MDRTNTHTLPSPDLVVIGAGVIGLALAREGATQGGEVLLLDPREPGRGATWAAAGMISPLGEAKEAGAFLSLALASAELYPSWVADIEGETGIQVEYRRSGKVLLATSAEEVAELEARSRMAASVGMATEWWNDATLPIDRSRWGRPIHRALHLLDEARVDPRALALALARACEARGVRFRTGTRVLSVRRGTPGLLTLLLDDGSRIETPQVVLAAGAWSSEIDGIPLSLPRVRPVRGTIIALRPMHHLSPQVLESHGLYLVPKDDGQLLVGATMEDAGFHEHPRAREAALLLGRAIELLPELGEAEIEDIWTGLRPASADGEPVLGAVEALPGLTLATGHFRNGILLAPITVELLRSGILGGRGGPPIPRDFDANRQDVVPHGSGTF